MTLLHTTASPIGLSHLSHGEGRARPVGHTDITRVGLIAMLFLNVALAIMVLAPQQAPVGTGKTEPRIDWHGNSGPVGRQGAVAKSF